VIFYLRKKYIKIFCVLTLATIFFTQVGCATQNKTIVTGMLTGALVGAGVGHQFVHHGENKKYEQTNTIITSAVFAMITGGVMAWHYRQLAQAKVEISGRYSRYRLCDPEEIGGELAKQLELGRGSEGMVYEFKADQIGKNAISLDDSTKWIFPTFRKRYLQAERGETQVISTRYIWEIIRPGQFVTRSQNPNYFYQPEEEPK